MKPIKALAQDLSCTIAAQFPHQFFNIMADCTHCTWIQLCGNESNCSFIDHHRFQNLVQSLPDPCNQTPTLLFFLGQKNKDEALRYIFPHNNLKKTKLDGFARIRVDNSTASTKEPILFADADLSTTVLDRHRPLICHQEDLIPVQWQCSDMRSVVDHVLARVLFASSNLLVLFADDYSTVDHLTNDLARWINVGVSSDAPTDTRPRLLIVTKGKSPDNQQRIRRIYCELEVRARYRLNNLFSLVSTQYLDDGPLSALALYRPLKEEIFRQKDEIRSVLLEKHWLFSAPRLASLFKMRLHHAAAKVSDDFSIIKGCRKYHEIPNNYPQNLATVISFGVGAAIKYENTTSFIASSILMDAYPPDAHSNASSPRRLLITNGCSVFDPDLLFSTIYSSACRDAFLAHYPPNFAEFLTKEVQKHLKSHFQLLEAGGTTATALHIANVQAKTRLWSKMISNGTCLPCLITTPQHGLSCGHSVCDTCASKLGCPAIGEEYRFNISTCLLCDSDSKATAKIKPPTSGVRILSIDGGGTRVVIPLEVLRLLQRVLGDECAITDFFDIAGGTSAGIITTRICLEENTNNALQAV